MSLCSACLHALCKGKRKPVIEDRNTHSRRAVWYSHESAAFVLHVFACSTYPRQNKNTTCINATDHLNTQDRRISSHTHANTSPNPSPPGHWPSLQHSSASPCCQRGSWAAPVLQNPGKLFKTGCLAEASFPSNKQSAEPDFLEAGWKYSSHIISTSRILEHLGPWGSVARLWGCGGNLRPCARQWECGRER